MSTSLLDKQESQPWTRLLEPNGHYFENKISIVTGASSGIGKAIAIELAHHGAKVILSSRNRNRLEQVAHTIRMNGDYAEVHEADVTYFESCESLINKTIEKYGRIDLLVNNAGISMRANFLDVKIEVLKRLMDTNFWGTVYCTKLALAELIKNKGSLISISSICGITPLPGRTGYAASKHALDGFIDTIRVENLDNNLHVLSVHPGFTTSNIRNVALNKDGEEQGETPRDEDKMMSAAKVATEVVKAIQNHKRDITLTSEGKLITWIYKTMPSIADKILYNEMKKEEGSPI